MFTNLNENELSNSGYAVVLLYPNIKKTNLNAV